MPVKSTTIFFFSLLLLSTSVQAEEPSINATDIELFEFIADWETNDGQWVAPSNFEQAQIREREPEDVHMSTTQEGHYDH